MISELFLRPVLPLVPAAAPVRFSLMLFCLFMWLEERPRFADCPGYSAADPPGPCAPTPLAPASGPAILYWVSSLFIFWNTLMLLI